MEKGLFFNIPLQLPRMRVVRIFFTLFFVVVNMLHAQAQTQPAGGDLSKVKVDQLTDAQIRDMYTKFQSSGMSEQEFYSSLAQRGMPSEEVSKLRQRITNIASQSQRPSNQNDQQQRRQLDINPDSTRQNRNPDTLTALESKIFGYRIFHNSNTTFTPNLNMATPRGYVVGPGDVLVLQVYGVAQNSYSLTVSPEGNVTIPDIGIAHVSGLSIDAVTSQLQNKMSLRYSGMRGSNPNTFLQVTLGNIRNIKVNMIGEILKPGTYQLPSYVTVFNALFAAGGPTTNGTFRHVQVYRMNKMVAEIDLYDFLLNGKIAQNIRLEDNDVILIRPISKRVEVMGRVRTAGLFEMKPNETFSDLLKFTGGFSEGAYRQRITVNRNGPTEKQFIDINENDFGKASLEDGDIIQVGAIVERYTNRVQITGAVNRAGAFELTPNMTIRDLVRRAGGFKGDAFLKRAILFRQKADLMQEVFSIDLTDTSANAPGMNKLLVREDVLNIASKYDLKEEYYVQISGEVNNPNVYSYADSMTIGNLILRAGGFKYSASGSTIEIARRTLDDPEKIAQIIKVQVNRDLSIEPGKENISLRPFDQVFVRTTPGYQLPKMVTIQGEVQFPGTYAIENKEMRVSELLSRAGGLTNHAYLKGARLLRRTKSYDVQSTSEIENQNLNRLKETLRKDSIYNEAESNKEFEKRIDSKIRQNEGQIQAERDREKKRQEKEKLLEENTLISNSRDNGQLMSVEKTQELVAIDFDQIMQKPGSHADIVLKEGDVIDIPEILQTVRVRGGVLYPVSVRYDSTYSFKDYVNHSGGFTSNAIRRQSFLVRANGRVERVKHFLFFKSYPKVDPGAEIYVPVDLREKPPFSYDKLLTLITSSLTLLLLFKSL